MGTGDLWFDTANNNRPYRYSGTAWIATDDPRIAANAAAVQLQSQAIADLQSGAQAMWTAKASAGQITAGIGLIAKSDGTSQVAISASQVFVFDPNSSTPMAPLFAIDNGQAVIAEAIIRKATIQILNAEKITADYVKAGVSISSPLINGGQIDMGNAFMAGGAAGFGKGGPYGGWGWGWHTIIYADGGIYTNRLHAEGGYVRNMTIGNCTIDEDCVVRGTIYANRIVGDITNMFTHKGAFSVPAYNRARNLILVQGGIRYRRRVSGQGTIGLNMHVYLNGALIETQTTTVNLPTGGSVDIAVSIQPFMNIPANTSATISFATSTSGSVSALGPEYNDTDRAVWLMALS
ncbi:Fibronectin type III protein [compost metagenome]